MTQEDVDRILHECMVNGYIVGGCFVYEAIDRAYNKFYVIDEMYNEKMSWCHVIRVNSEGVPVVLDTNISKGSLVRCTEHPAVDHYRSQSRENKPILKVGSIPDSFPLPVYQPVSYRYEENENISGTRYKKLTVVGLYNSRSLVKLAIANKVYKPLSEDKDIPPVLGIDRALELINVDKLVSDNRCNLRVDKNDVDMCIDSRASTDSKRWLIDTLIECIGNGSIVLA